ncbi:MAG: 16S rRNA (cytosine(967)-C(5))-methyltransferase RsmB [Desulfosudaceae bacterium]
MKTPFPDARSVAAAVLNELETGRQTLDGIMEKNMSAAAMPDRRERALVTTLVYGVLRHRNALDWLIAELSRTPFQRIEPGIRNTLRLALFQIYYLDRIPDYAAVNAAVTMAGRTGHPRLKGFVNGVLRAAIRNREQVAWPDVRQEDLAPLAVALSLPEWLLQRWVDRYGRKMTETMGRALNTIPPVTVRANLLKTTPARARESLSGEVSRLQEGRYAPGAFSFYSPRVPVDELDAFRQGWIQVQDEAAQLVCRYFDPRPQETILDACAGRGGKTAHIAQLMENRGKIYAVDRNPGKLAVLEGEMKRLGVRNVTAAAADLLQDDHLPGPARYDRIFADCPCSGLGVLRRNPDTRWSVTPTDIERHRGLQVRLLDRLAPRVRPGGLLLYAVCSREPEENEQVIEAFLNLHPEFGINRKHGLLGGAAEDLVDEKGCFASAVYPHDLDGFFGVRLQKKS